MSMQATDTETDKSLNMQNMREPNKSCRFIGTQVYFYTDSLAFCCSPTNGKCQPFVGSFDGGAFPLNDYLEAADALNLQNNTDPDSTCSGCLHLKEMQSPKFEVFTRIGLDCFGGCPLRCKYCYTTQGNLPRTPVYSYDISDTLKDMLEQHLIDTRTLAIWGGTEPTFYPHFEKTAQLLREAGLAQEFITSGVTYSKEIVLALQADNGSFLSVSPDTAIAETYRTIKGADACKQVWANLLQYVQANPDAVNVKMIVLEENSSREERAAFRAKCKEIGVKNIELSFEYFSFWTGTYPRHLVRALKKMYRECQADGFHTFYRKADEFAQLGNLRKRHRKKVLRDFAEKVYRLPISAPIRFVWRTAHEVIKK